MCPYLPATGALTGEMVAGQAPPRRRFDGSGPGGRKPRSLFTLVWCTRLVSVTHLSGRHARIDVSLDGVRFTRSDVDAARRRSGRIQDIDWESVAGARVETTRKGRA